jgi:hypothetical protein
MKSVFSSICLLECGLIYYEQATKRSQSSPSASGTVIERVYETESWDESWQGGVDDERGRGLEEEAAEELCRLALNNDCATWSIIAEFSTGYVKLYLLHDGIFIYVRKNLSDIRRAAYDTSTRKT